MAKSNKTTVKSRVSKVGDMLMSGKNRTEITQFAAKEWKVSQRQTDEYISNAKDEIEKTTSRRTDFNYAKAEYKLDLIYNKAMKLDQLNSAISATKELATLQGLYKTETGQTGTITFISNIEK